MRATDTSIKHNVEHPRYGVFDDRDEYVPVDDSSSVIQMDRNKCILCNRCVEACNDVQAAGVLRMEGSADDVHVGFQKPDADTWDESTCISCGHCVTVCPTGSLVEKGLVDVATLPLPGFTHKNSIGEVIEHEPAETAETSDSPNRDVPAEDEPLAGDEPLPEDGSVRQMVESERSGLARDGQDERAGGRVGARRHRRRASVRRATAEKVTEHTLSIGSLFDVAVALVDVRLSRVNVAETTCGYCTVGCRFDVYGKQRGDDREILGVRATDPENAPVNNISTCVKGKFGYDFVDSDERLKQPLIKEDGEFREASWDEGLRVTEMFEEVLEEHLHGMYIVGENPVVSEPHIEDPEQALRDIDFLVVQEIFMTETAKYADVVLPAATFAEKTGTFTNTERRIQMVNPVLDPPGDARSDLDIVTELASRMGFDWDYDDPAEVMEEVNDLVPIYGSVTHERLRENGDGLQWPVWDEDHPGTPFLYEDEFNFEDGRARFVPADFGGDSDAVNEDYPFTLTTGRVLYHWHTGSMTRRVEALMSQVGESFVEMHPETAKRLGIADGEYARVTSERGSIVVKTTVTDRVDERSVFGPMHFLNGRVNQLTENELDPTSYIPGYKVTSVDVTPLGPDPDADPLAAPSADD